MIEPIVKIKGDELRQIIEDCPAMTFPVQIDVRYSQISKPSILKAIEGYKEIALGRYVGVDLRTGRSGLGMLLPDAQYGSVTVRLPLTPEQIETIRKQVAMQLPEIEVTLKPEGEEEKK